MSIVAGLVAGGPLFINVRPYRSAWTTLITVCMVTSGLVAAESIFARDGLSAAELPTSARRWLSSSLRLCSDRCIARYAPSFLTIIAFVPLLALFVPIVIGTWVPLADYQVRPTK